MRQRAGSRLDLVEAERGGEDRRERGGGGRIPEVVLPGIGGGGAGGGRGGGGRPGGGHGDGGGAEELVALLGGLGFGLLLVGSGGGGGGGRRGRGGRPRRGGGRARAVAAVGAGGLGRLVPRREEAALEDHRLAAGVGGDFRRTGGGGARRHTLSEIGRAHV